MQIGATGAEFVADMLRYNNTISILDLRANGLRDEVCSGCNGLSFFHSAIYSLKHMLFYSLCINYLQGAKCLAQSFKVVNEALTSIDLAFNEIRVSNIIFFPFFFFFHILIVMKSVILLHCLTLGLYTGRWGFCYSSSTQG